MGPDQLKREIGSERGSNPDLDYAIYPIEITDKRLTRFPNDSHSAVQPLAEN